MCNHSRKIGDNYGISCANCEEKLQGFGYGGWFGNKLAFPKTCIHFFLKDENGEEICMYCEIKKIKEEEK